MNTTPLASIVAMAVALALPLASVHAESRDRANVPPALEMEVLDPRVDPRGNPAIRISEDEHQTKSVEIPEVVIVHRYYYTGDRTFQGPMLPGGPSIVVVNHPKSGERCYIPVQMLPGAPVVTYTGRTITYDYNTHAISINFGWFSGPPKIAYRSGTPWVRKVGDAIEDTKLPGIARRTSAGSMYVAKETLAVTAVAAKTAATPFVQASQFIPGVKMLVRSPEQQANSISSNVRQRYEVERARVDQLRDEATVKTVR